MQTSAPRIGLTPACARRAVELDGAEQVAEVGDGERALAVGGRGGDGVVDPQGAVDDRKLGVRAQVNEGHSAHSREPVALAAALEKRRRLRRHGACR